VAWKVIVKQLTSYFEGIADIENNTAKELTKLAGVIQVPFKAGNQFLGEGGLQDIYYDIRDKTRIIADQHADLGRTIDSSIVQHLQKLRAEVKAHIKNVQNDTGKLAAGVAKERELSTKLVGELANNISTFKNTPMHLQPKNDPFISNQAVARQLQRQVLEENLLQKSIVMMQQNSAHFEEGIVRSIQSAWQTFDEWQSRASSASQEVFRSLTTHLSSLAPDREWIQFAARSDHLLDPDTPLRDPSSITYPLKDDSSVVPVHTGHLERKKRFTRTYTESYFVLTPAGFLHEYTTSDPTVAGGQNPHFSLFLPTCTLGPASSPTAKAHKFHIEGRKDGLGTTKSGSFKGLLGSEGTKAWSFRARSHDDMMEWWNDIRMLCARYLVASEQVDRSGPVEAAVKSAGYNSEDYEDEEEEGEGVQTADEGEAEGSSVEEEVDHHVDNTFEDTAPPGYTHPDKHYPIEIGPNGYAIDKKHSVPGQYPSTNNAYHEPQHNHPHFVNSQPVSAHSTGPNVDTDPAHATSTQGGARVGRRLSRRQMEKAPESRNLGDEATADVTDDDDMDGYIGRRGTTHHSISTSHQPPPPVHPASVLRHTTPPPEPSTGIEPPTHPASSLRKKTPSPPSAAPPETPGHDSSPAHPSEEEAEEEEEDMYAPETSASHDHADHEVEEEDEEDEGGPVEAEHNAENHDEPKAAPDTTEPAKGSPKPGGSFIGGLIGSVVRGSKK